MFLTLSFLLLILLRDYHNIRAAAYNYQVRELSRRTTELADSRIKHSTLLLSWGRASAPAGCSPRDSGRLLSSRVGSSGNYLFLLIY